MINVKYLIFVFITFFSVCSNDLFSDKNFSDNLDNNGQNIVRKKYDPYKTNIKFPKRSKDVPPPIKNQTDTLNPIIMPRGFY